MNDSKQKISVDEAKATLASLEQYQEEAIASITPPKWYTLTNAFLVAFFTFAFASMGHENIWAVGVWISAVLIIVFEIFLIYSYSLLGIKIKQLPKDRSGVLSLIALMLLFIVIFGMARYEDWFHIPWRPYAFAALNFIIIFYVTIKHPSGEIFVKSSPSVKQSFDE